MTCSTIIHTDQLELILDHDNLILIDVRFNLKDIEWGRTTYKESHIRSAQYLHIDEDLSGDIIPGVTGRHPWPNDTKIESMFSRLGIHKDSQVVIYDQSHGGIAARFWAMCLYAGIENAAILNGGWTAWQAESRPVSSIESPKEPTEFKISQSFIEVISVDEAIVTECLIDARAEKRYLGLEEPIDPIAGHIPGAKSMPFLNNLTEEFKWKTKEELQQRFMDTESKNCAVYCGSGVTACHNMIAMKIAGYKLPKLYVGSWSHYITDESRPIA